MDSQAVWLALSTPQINSCVHKNGKKTQSSLAGQLQFFIIWVSGNDKADTFVKFEASLDKS